MKIDNKEHQSIGADLLVELAIRFPNDQQFGAFMRQVAFTSAAFGKKSEKSEKNSVLFQKNGV
tara:strand:+ start:353 stop:541 length:189 start_codon:yes stop_codon:yes gene_type:complete